MKLPRRRLLSTALAVPAASALAAAPQRFNVILDWFVNPDHAPLFAARYIGAYARAGLEVVLTAPTDPDIPPRLVAAGQADMALSYQTALYLLVDQGLPLRRTGTLIDQPLNTLMALPSSGIKTIADFKGKKIGFSVAGVEEALIGTMLATAGLGLQDVTLINVNFALVTSLLSHEVDGVIGGYRNVEVVEVREKGFEPVVFLPEDYGVPPSDELIMLSGTKQLGDPRLPKFLGAVREGAAYLKAHPEAMWRDFIKDQPSLNDKLDNTGWFQSIGYFAQDPAHLDVGRYETYRDFMHRKRLIKQSLPVGDYAVQITT